MSEFDFYGDNSGGKARSKRTTLRGEWFFPLSLLGLCLVGGLSILMCFLTKDVKDRPLWLMGLMYMYPQMVTYELKFSGLVRNSMLMAIGRLPVTLGLKLLSLVPSAIALLVSIVTPYMQYALLILAVYYIVLGFALSRFVQASYANAVFDHYINPNIEGAAVGRGLYVDTDDEEDEENVEAQG